MVNNYTFVAKKNYMHSFLQKKIKFNHKVSVQIRFEDLDIAGHVNNAVYFSYFNYARMIYFKDVIDANFDWVKFGIVLVNMNVDFYEPIFLNDEICILTKIVGIGNKSINMIQTVEKKDKNGNTVIVAACSSVLVGYDYKNKKSLVVPKHWKDLIVDFEKNVVLKSN